MCKLGCGLFLSPQLPLTPAYKPHSQLSHTPSLATQILGKKNLERNKINQKWSLEKEVLPYMYMHCFFKFLARVTVQPKNNARAEVTQEVLAAQEHASSEKRVKDLLTFFGRRVAKDVIVK